MFFMTEFQLLNINPSFYVSKSYFAAVLESSYHSLRFTVRKSTILVYMLPKRVQ